MKRKDVLTFLPLDKFHWDDFVTLFGERGACGGCWCMAWRLKSKDFEDKKGVSNKLSMKKIVFNNELPGIIAYYNSEPIGWCAFAPREKYVRLNSSRVLAPIDNKPVWSISCFFIKKDFRKKGLSVKLIKAVIKYCKNKKIGILEAYPQEPYDSNIPAAFAWTGIPAAFKKAGFIISEKRSPKRPIMRYYF